MRRTYGRKDRDLFRSATAPAASGASGGLQTVPATRSTSEPPADVSSSSAKRGHKPATGLRAQLDALAAIGSSVPRPRQRSTAKDRHEVLAAPSQSQDDEGFVASTLEMQDAGEAAAQRDDIEYAIVRVARCVGEFRHRRMVSRFSLRPTLQDGLTMTSSTPQVKRQSALRLAKLLASTPARRVFLSGPYIGPVLRQFASLVRSPSPRTNSLRCSHGWRACPQAGGPSGLSDPVLGVCIGACLHFLGSDR